MLGGGGCMPPIAKYSFSMYKSSFLGELCFCNLNPGSGRALWCSAVVWCPPPTSIYCGHHWYVPCVSVCFRWGLPPLSPPGVTKLPQPSPMSLLLFKPQTSRYTDHSHPTSTHTFADIYRCSCTQIAIITANDKTVFSLIASILDIPNSIWPLWFARGNALPRSCPISCWCSSLSPVMGALSPLCLVFHLLILPSYTYCDSAVHQHSSHSNICLACLNIQQHSWHACCSLLANTILLSCRHCIHFICVFSHSQKSKFDTATPCFIFTVGKKGS